MTRSGPLAGLRVLEIAGIGLGLQVCLERNPRLVYGRMTAEASKGRWRTPPVTLSIMWCCPVRSGTPASRMQRR